MPNIAAIRDVVAVRSGLDTDMKTKPERPLGPVDSTDGRNTLIFEERGSVEDGVSTADLFYIQAEG